MALRAGPEKTIKVLRGKFQKRAHSTGIRNAVTKSWSERHFVFEHETGDLYYWHDQPGPEFCKSNADKEHFGGTRVVLARARLASANGGARCTCVSQLLSLAHARLLVCQ